MRIFTPARHRGPIPSALATTSEATASRVSSAAESTRQMSSECAPRRCSSAVAAPRRKALELIEGSCLPQPGRHTNRADYETMQRRAQASQRGLAGRRAVARHGAMGALWLR